jgi:hypothetical protein
LRIAECGPAVAEAMAGRLRIERRTATARGVLWGKQGASAGKIVRKSGVRAQRTEASVRARKSLGLAGSPCNAPDA